MKSFTFALIKPGFLSQQTQISCYIERYGLEVVQYDKLRMTRSLAESLYEEHRGQDFFERLVDYTSSDEVIAMILVRKEGIKFPAWQLWRLAMGPTKIDQAKSEAPWTIRGGLIKSGDIPCRNVVHGSDSAEVAIREVALFFPNSASDYIVNC